MNEDEKWRYCDDPAELAAAVAELGRKQVQVELPGEGWESMTCSRGWSAIRWVEVRAPRAVPEPETERVPWWEALMNERTAVGYDGTPMKLRRGQTILYTRVDGGGGRLMYDDASHPEDKRPLVDPDGTVEVLKDGER